MKRNILTVLFFVLSLGLLAAEGSSAPASAPAKAPAATSKAQAAPVNINTASAVELTSLPFIGETKAKAIVDYRAKNGNFKSLDDLAKVKGIGVKTVEKLRGKATV